MCLVGHMWAVEDSLTRLKKQVVEAVAEWNVRLSDAEAAGKREEKEKRKSQEVKVHQNSLSEIVDGVSTPYKRSFLRGLVW